jgi:hypothetical protein
MAGPAESALDGRIRHPGTVSTWARRPTSRLARGRTSTAGPTSPYVVSHHHQSINKTKALFDLVLGFC